MTSPDCEQSTKPTYFCKSGNLTTGTPSPIPILIVCSENIGPIPATDLRNSKNYVGSQSVRGGGAGMKTPPTHISVSRGADEEDMRMSGKMPLMSPDDDK